MQSTSANLPSVLTGLVQDLLSSKHCPDYSLTRVYKHLDELVGSNLLGRHCNRSICPDVLSGRMYLSGLGTMRTILRFEDPVLDPESRILDP